MLECSTDATPVPDSSCAGHNMPRRHTNHNDPVQRSCNGLVAVAHASQDGQVHSSQFGIATDPRCSLAWKWSRGLQAGAATGPRGGVKACQRLTWNRLGRQSLLERFAAPARSCTCCSGAGAVGLFFVPKQHMMLKLWCTAWQPMSYSLSSLCRTRGDVRGSTSPKCQQQLASKQRTSIPCIVRRLFTSYSCSKDSACLRIQMQMHFDSFAAAYMSQLSPFSAR